MVDSVDSKVDLCLREFVVETKKELGNVIIAVVHTGGSVVKEGWIEDWSDLDICVVVGTVNWKILREIHKINKRLIEKCNIRLGTSVISRKEYDSIKLVDNCFKTLLMKRGLTTGRSKIVSGRNPRGGTLDFGKKKDIFIRELSFLKAYLRNGVRDLEGTKLLQRCIKCAHYVVLSALLYEGALPNNRGETIEEAKKRFGNFLLGFDSLEQAANLRKRFGQLEIDYEKESEKIITFVERFVAYFYERNVYV